MKPILKIMAILAIVFASTFIIARVTGYLSIPQIEAWLEAANNLSPYVVGVIVAVLLFADLFIAVPTMTLCLLAGYFLGFPLGSIAAISGMMLAGTSGHLISHLYGNRLLRFVCKDERQISDAVTTFQNHGFVMILIARAVPILPEVTACLAGMTRMPFVRFLAAWSLNTVPYALICTYAGSISSLANPKPALITAVLVTAFLWTVWLLLRRRYRLQEANS